MLRLQLNLIPSTKFFSREMEVGSFFMSPNSIFYVAIPDSGRGEALPA